jgi:hypothetical protein
MTEVVGVIYLSVINPEENTIGHMPVTPIGSSVAHKAV